MPLPSPLRSPLCLHAEHPAYPPLQELVQLRKQQRKAVATIQHLEAMAAKQNAVLLRKINDATAARRKLKELQGPASRQDSGKGAAGQQQQQPGWLGVGCYSCPPAPRTAHPGTPITVIPEP